ncbi:uncharacterized protein C19orf44 homolog [Chanos chanos]|uniref:Uncharacterized protein C19orf44 homolog n=1 Tax=Chanos chanos TaxID=29144 RepID=A0A6J2W5U4_CHACN|nr:uncharacterized protein C19orf44 homolog [Chanos chanos]
MWNRAGSRSSALERAMAQLSGRRVPQTGVKFKDEVCLSSFQMKSSQVRQSALLDLSDLSTEDVESDDQGAMQEPKMTKSPPDTFSVGGGNRFLKKTAQNVAASSSSQGLSRKPLTVPKEPLLAPQRASQSAAHTRLALIEERIRNRTQRRNKADETTDTAVPRWESAQSTQSSSELSGDGSRFLKKKAMAVTQEPKDVKSPPPSAQKSPPIRTAVSKGVSLDSDEEDMRKLLGESLDSSVGDSPSRRTERQRSPASVLKSFRKTSQTPQPPPDRPPSSSASSRVRRSPAHSVRSASATLSPSPSPPTSRSPPRTAPSRAKFSPPPSVSSPSSRSEIHSLDELFPAPADRSVDRSVSEASGLSDDFKVNIMSLDDLAPFTLGGTEKSNDRTEPDAVLIQGSRLLSLEDFAHEVGSPEDKPALEETPVEYESDFESEIHSETAGGASEISERLTEGGDDGSALSEVPDDISYRSRSDGDGDRTVSDRTRSVSAGYSQSESRSRRSRASHSRSSSSSSSPPSWSSDVTVTRSGARRPSSGSRVREAAVQTHAEGLSYTWSTGLAALGPSVGLQYVDPTPVATHVISAEAVEALSAYSPAALALNDMLRQQLALTRSFVESSRHLHRSVMDSLGPPDYRYTTLHDTKEFIRCHRPPALSMEEALQEVLQEMKEYHYI